MDPGILLKTEGRAWEGQESSFTLNGMVKVVIPTSPQRASRIGLRTVRRCDHSVQHLTVAGMGQGTVRLRSPRWQAGQIGQHSLSAGADSAPGTGHRPPGRSP